MATGGGLRAAVRVPDGLLVFGPHDSGLDRIHGHHGNGHGDTRGGLGLPLLLRRGSYEPGAETRVGMEVLLRSASAAR